MYIKVYYHLVHLTTLLKSAQAIDPPKRDYIKGVIIDYIIV